MKKLTIQLCPACRAKFKKATEDRIKNQKAKGLSVGRPRRIDPHKIMEYVKENPQATQRAIATALGISVGTVNHTLRIFNGKC